MGRSKELGSSVDPAVKPRSKNEKDETNIIEETQEIYIPPEKRKQIIKDLKLGPAHDKIPRFITKKWIEVNLEILTIRVNQ